MIFPRATLKSDGRDHHRRRPAWGAHIRPWVPVPISLAITQQAARSLSELQIAEAEPGTPLSEPEESTEDDKRPHRTELATVLRVQTAHRSPYDHDTLLRLQNMSESIFRSHQIPHIRLCRARRNIVLTKCALLGLRRLRTSLRKSVCVHALARREPV